MRDFTPCPHLLCCCNVTLQAAHWGSVDAGPAMGRLSQRLGRHQGVELPKCARLYTLSAPFVLLQCVFAGGTLG
jgi:hypothetical protein